jgi:hypothetical protein
MAYRSRESVRRILNHQEADRVPFDGFPDPDALLLLDSLDLDDDQRACYAEGDFRYVSLKGDNANREKLAPYTADMPEEASISSMGIGRIVLKSVEGYHAGHQTFHPLAKVNTVAELEAFPFPDYTPEHCHAHLDGAVREAREQEFTVIGQMSQTILEMAYNMRGLDRLFTDFYERPDYIELLFERLGKQRRFQARRLAQAGVDVLRIGDDIAMQSGLIVSPATYRQWIKPHHAAVIAAAREINPDIDVLYHSDGKLTALLDDLIEIGVTAINPCQPECMDPAEIKRDYGDRLVLWGCSSVQSVYAHGTKGDVINEIRTRMRTVAPGGGLVIQFTNMIVTDKVLENLRHFFEAFYDLARYQ